jgi:hypothetical protein
LDPTGGSTSSDDDEDLPEDLDGGTRDGKSTRRGNGKKRGDRPAQSLDAAMCRCATRWFGGGKTELVVACSRPKLREPETPSFVDTELRILQKTTAPAGQFSDFCDVINPHMLSLLNPTNR